MPDYPVRDALGNVIVEHAYDVAWDKPDPYDYSGDYPVLDGQGGVIIQHPYDPALPGTNPITGTGPVLAALTDGDTLSSAVTWGSYLPGGATADRQMRVDGGAWVAYVGSTVVGSTVVAEGEVWQVREVVSYGVFSRTFYSDARTVNIQIAQFGDGPNAQYRPYDASGALLTLTGTPVLIYGSAGGYTASISDGGLYFGAGSGAPDGAVYRCDVDGGGTVDIRIVVVANARSISGIGDISPAVAAVRSASQSTDWILIMRGGDYGPVNGTTFDLTDQTFAGSMTDPNAALHWAARDLAAEATVSGGSVTFRSERHLAAVFWRRWNALGCGPFIYDGIDFAWYPAADFTGGGSNQDTQWQLRHWLNGGNDFPGIVKNCRFGRAKNGQGVLRSVTGATVRGVIEDSQFDGLAFGASAYSVIRRCDFDRIVVDCIRAGFGATTQSFYAFYANRFFRSESDAVWAGDHKDAIQVGSGTTTALVDVEVHDNRHYNVSGNRQGMPYCDDSQTNIRLRGGRNLVLGSHYRSMQFWKADVSEQVYNTVVRMPNGGATFSGGLVPTIISVSTEGPSVGIARNLCHQVNGMTAAYGVAPENRTISQTGDAFNEVFAGPFVNDPTTGTALLEAWPDLASASREVIAATLDAAFTIRPDGPAAGRGHDATVLWDWPPISTFDNPTDQPGSTWVSGGIRGVCRGTGLPISVAGGEYRILATDKATVVQDWGDDPGTVDLAQCVELRVMTASTPLTDAISTLTIDGHEFTTTARTSVFASDKFVGRTAPFEGTLAPRTINLVGALNAGAGGENASPQPGDLVVVFYGYASTTIRSTTITTGGYSTQALTFANSTCDSGGIVGWKIMGETPDTEVAVGGATASGTMATIIVHVYRGIDPTTPMDVSPAVASGVGSAIIDPPAITPVTAGALIVCLGVNARLGSDAGVSGWPEADYLDSKTTALNQNTGLTASALMGDVEWPGGGAYNPVAFSVTGSAGSSSWSAVTLALRPEA